MTNADIAVIKEQLKQVNEKLDVLIIAINGVPGKATGLIIEVDRLKQIDARRTWLIRTIVAALCALGLQSLWMVFT